ncbi:MAG: ABC transporter ATP-binding protein [Chloroflexi bacterium]|nr:MAG: ABC transporter ATP-binding protein [Chloroflexota bacterium]MBL1194164.1 ABC transporter ATP-binding protein [Chloroflexota bacterium]NOH11456.1 ABC transporter ATP-binding protein [Chloroflexota bacterium]
MLKLDKVTKTYRIGTFGSKELHAVSDVSFDIKDGEVVSLIGESGSGKTTIGKMVLHLTPISSGTILLDETDVSALKEDEEKEYYRTVQGVFQDPFSSYNPIFKADRIFEIIHDIFYPDVDEEAWKEKVHKALKDVGLNPEHVLDKFPHQLSGGQLQRFLIARALLLDIKFLVADEIISMLDASTRIDVLNLLAELKKKGLSILFITHDLSLANYISERAVILYRGCIAEMGTTEKIFNSPRHPYTQMLIASVPRLDQKWDKAVTIEENSDPIGYEDGCVYYGRCPLAYEKCRERPVPVEIDTDHFVACWKVTDPHT